MIKKNIKMQERNTIQNNFFKYKRVKEKEKKSHKPNEVAVAQQDIINPKLVVSKSIEY